MPIVNNSRAVLEEGMRLHQAGRFAEANACYRKLLAAYPDDPDALHLLGVLAHQRGDSGAAMQLIGSAIALRSDVAAYHINFGNALQSARDYEAAAAAYRRAIALDPRLFWAHNNLGNALSALDRPAEAVACFEQALALDASQAATWSNLGAACRALGALECAVEAYRQALERDSRLLEAWFNLGNVLFEMGDLEAADIAYRTTGSLDPDYGHLHWNHAQVLLAAGKLSAGWEYFEHRWVRPEIGARRPLGLDVWKGEDISGRSIAVTCEQGVGDQIMLATCLPDLVGLAQHRIVECDPRLTSLFARSFPAATMVSRSAPPDRLLREADIEIPLGSLPRHLRPTLNAFPLHRGVLVPDPARLDLWHRRLTELGPGRKIGISWRSRLRNKQRNRHYMAIGDLAPILAVEGIQFVNLQYDDCREELDWAHQELGVRIHTWPDVDMTNDFEAVAALIANLDAVVTAGNAVSALAGAVGVRTHCFEVWPEALASLGQEASPWLPAVTFHFRRWNESWRGVAEAIAAELHR